MRIRTQELLYRFEGHLEDLVVFGRVPAGLRMDGRFHGRITDGTLEGAELTGIDYLCVRPDGTGIVDARGVLARSGGLVSFRSCGHLLAPHDRLSRVLADDADVVMLDSDLAISACARFQTAAVDMTALNAAVVSHSGTVNFATRQLDICGWALGPHGADAPPPGIEPAPP